LKDSNFVVAIFEWSMGTSNK